MPYLRRDFGLTFAGGEPLLAFDTIRRLTAFLKEEGIAGGKRARYALTTNGSLVTGEVIDFLADNQFAVTLSFDVLAQDRQRRRGSYEKIRASLAALSGEPRISLGVNSVFTPECVGLFSRSLDLLMKWGVPRISFSLSVLEAWDAPSLLRFGAEMSRLRRLVIGHYRRTGSIPVEFFARDDSEGVFACAGGRDWLSLAPDGRLWGCSLFGDYFRGRERSAAGRAFGFGTLARFRRRPEAIHARHAPHYAGLSQDNFHSPDGSCFLCPEVSRCAVCPMTAALMGSPLGVIPRSLCEIQKIKGRELLEFCRELRLGWRPPPPSQRKAMGVGMTRRPQHPLDDKVDFSGRRFRSINVHISRG